MLEPQTLRDYISAMWVLIIVFHIVDLEAERIVRTERIELPYSSQQACSARVRDIVAVDNEAWLDRELGPPGTAIGVPQFPAPWSYGDAWCEERPQAGV